MTKYAEKILNFINSSTSHPTAEQVFFELKKTEPKIVLATVYNNLNYLCANGFVRRISVEGSPDLFDKNLKHDHLVCGKCGAIADFCFEDLTETLKKQFGGETLGYDLKVFYVCPDCRKKYNPRGENYE